MKPFKKIETYLFEQGVGDHWLLKRAYFCEDVAKSPIESIFLLACYSKFLTDGPPLLFASRLPETGQMQIYGSRSIAVIPQFRVGRFTADFAFVKLSGVPPRSMSNPLIVECDGHEFHERTKEQAAHDKRRDRDMVRRGLTVMRFAGSEVYGDPIGCAGEVLDHLRTR